MTQSLSLNWIKCQGDVWCNFNAVNLDHIHFNDTEGVYIIWHGGANPKVVYVGKGNIRDRIKYHRERSDIQQFSYLNLFVTWAKVKPEYQDGVEAYLANNWKPPIVGDRHPDTDPIFVNSPW